MEQIWLIPVIAVVVWVIAAVVRSAKAKELQAQKVEPMAQQPPRRRPTSVEIDRFLEEVKRRQTEQRRRREPQPMDAIPEVVPVVIPPTPRPKPPPVRRRPPITAAQPMEVIPIALPAESVSRIVAQPIAAPTIGSRTTKSQADQLAELRRLLASPMGLRAALIIHEILGPPKSKRRRS